VNEERTNYIKTKDLKTNRTTN